MLMQPNICRDTDAYKLTHWLQYPSELSKMYSYAEARIGSKYDWIVFFGLQMILKDHFVGQVLDDDRIAEAKELSKQWLGTDKYFNEHGWKSILDKYDGYLPMLIKAVPEGKIVNKGNVLFTIESTDPQFAPLMNSMETLLTHVWYPITIATHGMYILRDIYPHFLRTGSINNLPYVINDFGFRGVSSYQEAYRGAAAHLLNGHGSDTTAGDMALRTYYNASQARLSSVLASEHSVATVYGKNGEVEYVKHLLENTPENCIISCVGDSYDIFNFAQNVLSNPEIKKRIETRTGRFVLRPDSGDPNQVNIKLLDILGSIFGYHVNELGYKVLNDNVGIIQGDGMRRESIKVLYDIICSAGWSADNLVVGSGGGLLREHTRDDISFAIKASYAEFGDRKVNIQKDPITSSGKKSKTGKLKLVAGYTSGKLTDYMTVNHNELEYEGYVDELVPVYENGQLLKDYTFDEVLSNYSLLKFLKDLK